MALERSAAVGTCCDAPAPQSVLGGGGLRRLDLGQGAGRQRSKVLPQGCHRLDGAPGARVHFWQGAEGRALKAQPQEAQGAEGRALRAPQPGGAGCTQPSVEVFLKMATGLLRRPFVPVHVCHLSVCCTAACAAAHHWQGVSQPQSRGA